MSKIMENSNNDPDYQLEELEEAIEPSTSKEMSSKNKALEASASEAPSKVDNISKTKDRRHLVCAVKDCNAKSENGEIFHKFPDNRDMWETWRSLCGLISLDKRKHLSICGLHFKADDYRGNQKRNPDKSITRKLLKYGVVPSLGLPNLAFGKSCLNYALGALDF